MSQTTGKNSLNSYQKQEVVNEANLALQVLKAKLLNLMEVVFGVSKDDPEMNRYITGILYGPDAKITEMQAILRKQYTESIP